MSVTDRTADNVEDSPDLDTRDYSTDKLTFYEVGTSQAWIEIDEESTVDASEMR